MVDGNVMTFSGLISNKMKSHLDPVFAVDEK